MFDEHDLRTHLEALRMLHHVSRELNAARDLSTTLQTVVESVVSSLGFQVAAINVVRDDLLEVAAVGGSAEVRATLEGKTGPRAAWEDLLATAEPWGSLRFLSHTQGKIPDDVPSWRPEDEPPADPDAWHPDDALMAPLYSTIGELVGVLSVDLPVDGRIPGALQRELLETFAAQAAIAVDNARLHEQLLHLAAHDSLTGLLNRAELRARLDQLVDAGLCLAVVYCDLDQFKLVNDQFGHRAGDAVLVEIAHRLRTHVRRDDLVARVGGDEFVLVLCDIAQSDATALARSLAADVWRPIVLPATTQRVTVPMSVGLSHTSTATTVDELLNAADQAMYETKAATRDGMVGGNGREHSERSRRDLDL